MKKHLVQLFAAIIMLTSIDQIVKCLVKWFFYQTTCVIIPGVLSFKPVQNTDMSWFGSLGLEIFANYYIAVIFNLLIFIVAIVLYRYIYVVMEVKGKLMQIIFAFLFASVICSTIDRIFWGGSIDYLRLEGFFTFDLKDCYMTVFQVLLIWSGFKYQKEWSAFRVKAFIKEIWCKDNSSQ